MDGMYGQDLILLFIALKWSAILLGSLCAVGGICKLAEIIIERMNKR